MRFKQFCNVQIQNLKHVGPGSRRRRITANAMVFQNKIFFHQNQSFKIRRYLIHKTLGQSSKNELILYCQDFVFIAKPINQSVIRQGYVWCSNVPPATPLGGGEGDNPNYVKKYHVTPNKPKRVKKLRQERVESKTRGSYGTPCRAYR